MSEVRILFFRKSSGKVPLRDWLEKLPAKDVRKCLERIERLRDVGHRLNRPFAAFLRDGVHELRVESGNVNYRMLYFFHSTTAVLISHGIAKKTQEMPPREIERALRRKVAFEMRPEVHSFEWEA